MWSGHFQGIIIHLSGRSDEKKKKPTYRWSMINRNCFEANIFNLTFLKISINSGVDFSAYSLFGDQISPLQYTQRMKFIANLAHKLTSFLG